MSRHNDQAPIGNTCPMIDDIIRKMEYSVKEAKYIMKITTDEVVEACAQEQIDELTRAIEEIEKVREANSTLRDWGNEEYSRAEDLEKNKVELESSVEDLQDEIKSAEEKIADLEKELETITI